RRPVFIGKPEPTMALLAMEKTGFSKEQTALIGDRLYTDIACGVNAGINSIFVLSGEGTMDDVEKSETKPDFIYDNIKKLYEDIS
ncbi:MAG: HAD hydrolase-like protein, partial [Clostridia bacterium]|nr:HAD hydrolase-like protein [Clostridia bacterium]